MTKIWIEQCEAARRITDAFGKEKALGYHIGEKLLTFIRVADRDPEFAEELPKFIAEIKRFSRRGSSRNTCTASAGWALSGMCARTRSSKYSTPPMRLTMIQSEGRKTCSS